MTWTADYDPELQIADDHWVVALVDKSLLSAEGAIVHRYHCLGQAANAIEFKSHLGFLDGVPCFVAVLRPDATELLPDFDLSRLRSRLGVVPDDAFLLAGRAQQLAHWHECHRYCGRCGGSTQLHARERAMTCTKCDAYYYPQIAPCVMGMVLRDDRLLLAHNASFPQGLYSVLAGFIEPGETAEQALVREIKEEVGLVVDHLHYVGSQSWPFPSQLMLGYVAYSDAGDIRVDGEEIVHADWFTRDALPPIPPSHTLSGRLIDLFVRGEIERV